MSGKPVRLPLVADEATRDGEVSLDAHATNAVFEKDNNGLLWAYKRLGLDKINSGITATTGQGLYQLTAENFITSYTNGGSGQLQVYPTMLSPAYSTYTFPKQPPAYIGGDAYANSSAQGNLFYFLAAGTVYQAANFTVNGWTSGVAPSGTPDLYVPGVVQLDGTFYVMDLLGNIRGSNVNDTTVWSAGNTIQANAVAGQGVMLAKQLAYVVALKEYDVEMFYDAGNTTGSPLSAVKAARLQFGCASAATVVYLGETLVWVAQDNTGELFVATMTKLQGQRISSPAIDRILLQYRLYPMNAFGLKINGHRLYVLQIRGTGIPALVFDLDSKVWSQWTLPDYFTLGGVAHQGQTILQGQRDGQLYYFSTSAAVDAQASGTAISWELVTPPFDGGSRMRKYLSRMDFLTDNTPAKDLQVRWSDDDQRTWSNWRTVDLAARRPTLTGCGSFYRRTFHFRHNGPQVLRLQAVDLHLDLGTL